MKKLIFILSALCLIGTACRDKEPNRRIGDTDLQGMWKVKAISIAGELTNIDSIHEDSPNSAVYQDISITIPNSAQGTITGNTFVNPVSFDFEIKENQQISLAKKGFFDGTRLAEDDWGAAFRDHIMFNVVKFDVSKDELKFLDSQDNPVIIFIKTREL